MEAFGGNLTVHCEHKSFLLVPTAFKGPPPNAAAPPTRGRPFNCKANWFTASMEAMSQLLAEISKLEAWKDPKSFRANVAGPYDMSIF